MSVEPAVWGAGVGVVFGFDSGFGFGLVGSASPMSVEPADVGVGMGVAFGLDGLGGNIGPGFVCVG